MSDPTRPLELHELEKSLPFLFRELSKCIHRDNVDKGFWPPQGRTDGELFMLMVTELAEGFEALRKGDGPDEHCPEFSSAEIELADTVIRILDTCGNRGYRIGEAIFAKLAYNRTRPPKHGKLF